MTLTEDDSLVLAALAAEMDLRFVTPVEIIQLHDESIETHGGTAGVRDEHLLNSAVSRQLQTAVYESANVFDVAASLAFGLCENHAFLDGNKRTAYLGMKLFLQKNDRTLEAHPAESYQTFVDLAAGRIDALELSGWIKSRHSTIKAKHLTPKM